MDGLRALAGAHRAAAQGDASVSVCVCGVRACVKWLAVATSQMAASPSLRGVGKERVDMKDAPGAVGFGQASSPPAG